MTKSIEALIAKIFGNRSVPDDVEVPDPSVYSEGTISIPESAIQIVQHVPKIQLDIGMITDYSVDNGVAKISALGAYGSFDEFESLLVKLEIPFIRTSVRDLVQHEIRVHVPLYNGKKATDTIMECNANGEAVITIEKLNGMLSAAGPQGLANFINRYDPRVNLKLTEWNDRIDIDAGVQSLGDVYVTVKAFRRAQLEYPNASVELCQAFANSVAHLCDSTFMITLGFSGPSARELALFDAAAEEDILGQLSYEDACARLLDLDGVIFGDLTDAMVANIVEHKSSNDCGEDLKKVRNGNKALN